MKLVTAVEQVLRAHRGEWDRGDLGSAGWRP